MIDPENFSQPGTDKRGAIGHVVPIQHSGAAMAQVDLLVDDPELAGELDRALGASGAKVRRVEGRSAALTGADIEHVIQIVTDDVTKAVIGAIVTRMGGVLFGYLKRQPKGLEIVVDGMRYKVKSDKDLDLVLDEIAIAYERHKPDKKA